MFTLEELKEKLQREDEVFLLEMLGITSEDIVNKFSDEIEDRYDELIEKVDD